MSIASNIVRMLSLILVVAGPVQAATDTESGEDEPGAGIQWNETMETLKSYTVEQRDKALKAGRRTLDAMDQRIEKMEAWTKENWSSLSEEAREKRTETLNAMRRQRNEAAEWYGAMKHGSSEGWDRVKQGFITSYDKLQKAYGDAVDWFQSGDEEQESSAQ